MARELLMQNNYEWVTAEGKTIETDKALNCKARNLKIEGQTYQDLIQNKFSYNGSGAWTGTFTVSRDGKYTIKTLDYNGYITLKCGGKKISKFLKSNTKYTIAFNIDTNFVNYKGVTISGEDDGYFNNSPSTNKNTRYFNDFNILMNSGYKKICFTTTSKITDYFSIGFNTTSTLSDRKVGDYFQISNIIMVEGDYTNTDLPTSINGIESVAERESKNLLENVKWYDGNINNSTGNPEPNANAIYSDLIDIDIATKYYTNIPYANGNAYRFRLYNSDGNYYKEGLTATSVDQLYSFRNSHPNIKKVRVLIFDKSNKPSQPILVPNLYTEGDVNVKGTSPYMNVKKQINVKPNTTYVVRVNIESINKGDNNYPPRLQIKKGITLICETMSSTTFNSGDNTTLDVAMYVNNAYTPTTICEANFKNIGIYESNLYPVKIAQSNNETDGIVLPNGVTNTIENSVHVKNVGKYKITGNENWEYRNQNDNFYKLHVTNILNPISRIDFQNSKSFLICNNIPVEYSVSEIKDNLYGLQSKGDGGGFVVSIPKSELTEFSVNSAKEWLKNKNATVWYELANPITEPLSLTEVNIPIPLRSLPNGVCDTIEGNKVIQRVYKYIINNNTEGYIENETTDFLRIHYGNVLPLDKGTVIPEKNGISNIMYQANHSNTFEHIYVTGISAWIFLPKSKLSSNTMDGVKSYLSNNPITVYYSLQTPIEHTINVPRVPITKGSNIITTTNNIKPNLYIKYKRKK